MKNNIKILVEYVGQDPSARHQTNGTYVASAFDDVGMLTCSKPYYRCEDAIEDCKQRVIEMTDNIDGDDTCEFVVEDMQ